MTAQTLDVHRLVDGLPHLYCIWQDELKLFPDAESACRWADRRGLKAVFVKDEPEPETEPGRIEYRFLGVTGEEEA